MTDIATGRDVAVLLADQPRRRWWEVEDAPELAFRFVDYELPPHRKTADARLEGEPASGPGMRADLLLVGEDGVPIVGEVKSATASGYDTDAVLALVQGLTACAQLLPPQQMERLERRIPTRSSARSRCSTCSSSWSSPSSRPRRTSRTCTRLRRRLLRFSPLSQSVAARRIAFIEARWDGQLELRLAALGSRPNGR